MVYLLKMGGAFHGYVSHNQMVNHQNKTKETEQDENT
jgi:hypothetical protein